MKTIIMLLLNKIDRSTPENTPQLPSHTLPNTLMINSRQLNPSTLILWEEAIIWRTRYQISHPNGHEKNKWSWDLKPPSQRMHDSRTELSHLRNLSLVLNLCLKATQAQNECLGTLPLPHNKPVQQIRTLREQIISHSLPIEKPP